ICGLCNAMNNIPLTVSAGDAMMGKTNITALDSFFQLLTGKANATDIDLGLLTEATMLSMEQQRE
ncbi:Protein pigeon, partial [Orchesella cincta]